MVIEFLPESAPWPMALPAEPDRGRVLQARESDGFTIHWTWRGGVWHSTQEHRGVDQRWSWAEIVEYCIRQDARLVSLPPMEAK